MGDDGEIIGCYLHDPRREKEDSGDGASRPCNRWFHRWITAWDIWRGEVPIFASFECELTPLWVWEE